MFITSHIVYVVQARVLKMNYLSLTFILSVVFCADSYFNLLERVKVEYFASKHLNHLYRLSLLTEYYSTDLKQEFDTLLGPYRDFFLYTTKPYSTFGKWENTFIALCPRRVSMEAARRDVLAKYDITVNTHQTVKDRLQELLNQYYPFTPAFIVEDEALHLFLLFLVYQLNLGVKVTYIAAMYMTDVGKVTKDEVEEMTDITDVEFPKFSPANFAVAVIDVNKMAEQDTGKGTEAEEDFKFPDAKTIIEDVKKIAQMKTFFGLIKNIETMTLCLSVFLQHTEDTYSKEEAETEEAKWSNVFQKIYDKKLSLGKSRKYAIIDVLALHYPETSVDDLKNCKDRDLKDTSELFFVKAWDGPDGFKFRNRTCIIAAMSYLTFNLPAGKT